MIVERKLQQWIRAGLALYAGSRVLLEEVFQSEDQEGTPSDVDGPQLIDRTKIWIPDEWMDATLRYGAVTFTVLGNTRMALTVDGDVEVVSPTPLPYHLVPADVARVQTYLQTNRQTVEVTYSRLPARLPAITIRLESDLQAEPFIGESVTYRVDADTATEIASYTTAMQATYLLTIATENPLETLWLYQVLTNYYLQSQVQFARWGWHDVRLRGSDVHPDVAYLPEQIYGRYLQLTGTRLMQAVSLDLVELITDVGTVPTPHYQELDSKGDPP